MRNPSRLFVTDCEGPLTRNDNAMEVAAAFVPDGAELFARLSRYDDFLADVLRKPGYNAGDTLRLIVPFLLAYGVGDRDVEEYSRRHGARRAGRPRACCATSPRRCPRTSSRPRTRPTSGRCVGSSASRSPTAAAPSIDLDSWPSHTRRSRLAARLRRSHPRAPRRSSCPRRRGRRPTCRPPTAPPSPSSTACSGPRCAPRGGAAPTSWPPCDPSAAAQARGAARDRGRPASRVPRRDVRGRLDHRRTAPGRGREAGGVTLSFNGNRYALAAAELAVAAADTSPTRELALAFAADGRAGIVEAIRAFPASSKPLPRVGLLAEAGAALSHASAYARSHVRGERVARLG